MASLDELLKPRASEDLEMILLSTLQSEGFPTPQWPSGHQARTLVRMIAHAGLGDRETLIGQLAAGGFLDLAAVLVDASGAPIEVWMEMLAQSMYALGRAEATFTRQRLTLTCTIGPGPYTRTAGQLAVRSRAGNYYKNVDAVAIPDGASVTAVFQAEKPGPLADDAEPGTIVDMTTPLPGVSVVNAETQFSSVVQRWNGSGSILPSMSTAMPSTPRTLKVSITTSGNVGEAWATLTIYQQTAQGALYTPTTYGPFIISETFADGEITLTFADGADASTGSHDSFIAGDHWFVSAPGAPQLASGCDSEALTMLAQRCRDRWPALSAIPTEGKIAGWIRQCAVENNFGALRVTVAPSLIVAGRVDCHVADASGFASPEQLQTIQDFIDERLQFESESVAVFPAETLAINPAGTVTVRRGKMAAVQAAFTANWAAYLSTVPIGGELPTGAVRIGKLWQTLMDAGAYDADGLQLNGAADDLPLDSDQVPAGGTDLLSWRELA
jgi:hypothetical protein